MRINAKIIKNVGTVNQWEYATEAYVQENQVNEVYFQLVDLDKTHSAEKSTALPDFPLRYMPQGDVISVEVTFPKIDSDDQFSVVAVQPFDDDKSIYKATLASTQVPSSGSIIIKLTEDGVERQFILKSALRVELLGVGGC
jgi:hypothetical protein